jgi:hypothetical protein
MRSMAQALNIQVTMPDIKPLSGTLIYIGDSSALQDQQHCFVVLSDSGRSGGGASYPPLFTQLR